MPRSFAENNTSFLIMAKALISLVLILLVVLALPASSCAQGPALTTISGTVYRADGTA